MATITAHTELSLADLEAFDPRAPLGGRERRFCCPLCGVDKPRDAAHRCLCLDTETGAFHCHRNGEKGKLTDFWEKRPDHNATNRAQRARMALNRALSLQTPPVEDNGKWREHLPGLQPLAQTRAAKYLQGRGISLEVAAAAGVQFHPDFYGSAAAMFPICDRHGQLVALNGRYTGNVTPKMPKTHTAGPKTNGAFMAPAICLSGRAFMPLDADAPAIIITEAPIDALTLATAGYPALACIGTNGPRWLHLACGLKRVLLATDADEAGDEAAAKTEALISAYTVRHERLRPEGAKDWNEMLQVLGRDELSSWLASRVL